MCVEEKFFLRYNVHWWEKKTNVKKRFLTFLQLRVWPRKSNACCQSFLRNRSENSFNSPVLLPIFCLRHVYWVFTLLRLDFSLTYLLVYLTTELSDKCFWCFVLHSYHTDECIQIGQCVLSIFYTVNILKRILLSPQGLKYVGGRL